MGIENIDDLKPDDGEDHDQLQELPQPAVESDPKFMDGVPVEHHPLNVTHEAQFVPDQDVSDLYIGDPDGEEEPEDREDEAGLEDTAEPAEMRNIFDTSSDEDVMARVAQEVREGKWGSGQEKRRALAAAGYDHVAVEKAVRKLVGQAKPVY